MSFLIKTYLKIANEETTFESSFQLSNDVLLHGVQSITDLMVRPGLINLDFADVESVMSSMGKAMMGTGEAEGEGRASKAAEMAITNPLIDDYTLKGAKGLLVNITGGKDLKLFEVDEAVNKVRQEVDHEAELIIGAITDPLLDGKMRVSIVATSLDGQQPESKSVINMVHRIQNRNPGYSDFSGLNMSEAFNFQTSTNTPVSDGATALKLEDELHVNNDAELNQVQSSQNVNETPANVSTEELSNDNVINENLETPHSEPSNGLENFGLQEEGSFELFENDGEVQNSIAEQEKETEEDELEIPAFLRRQKN